MSIQKDTVGKGPATPARQEPGIDQDDASQAGAPQGVEILSLDVADDFDTGGDPYNCTGQFCVIKIRGGD